MNLKIIGLIITILLLNVNISLTSSLNSSSISNGNILYVGGSGEGNYTSIQAAIDDASDGDTVFVYDDSSPYYEHIKVNARINLIGENKYTTVIDGENKNGAVVKIKINSTSIKGFTIRNGKVGIAIEDVHNNNITNCRIINNSDGISIWGSYNNIIHNIIQHQTDCAIIFKHDIKYNTENIISENNISYNGVGIRTIMCEGNEISYNEFFKNSGYAVRILTCMGGGSHNIVHHNNFISNNEEMGTSQGYESHIGNYWFSYLDSEGNYWSDYNGTDEDGDGIGDTHYIIDGDSNDDQFPFVNIISNVHDVGIKAITEPSGPDEPWPTGIYPVEAVVKNYGTFIEIDFNVNVKIWDISQEDDGGTLYYEDDSLVTASMAPGDEVTVVFTDVKFYDIDFLGTNNVTYRMEVTTELSGDNVSDNDQKVMFFTIRYSSLPPIPDLDGTFGDNGWYVSCVTITFIDRDPYADYVTYFRLNDGEWQVYTDPFIICEDGRYTLYYYSIDGHGNMVGVGEVSFKIDQTPPTIEDLTAEKIGCNTWLFIADVFDETSGINRVEFYADGEFVGEVTEAPFKFEWSGDGHTVQVVAYDNAGNSAESEVVDNGPIIKIESPPFPSMLPCLEAYVVNTGDADATDVEWSFKWYGGWLLGERLSDKMRETSGEIPVISPERGRVISSLKFGFGDVAIIIRAECAEGSSDEVVIEAKMMWFFLKILG